jgi:hypothetical protein
MAEDSEKEILNISKLEISTIPKSESKATKKKQKVPEVVDSWEDEDGVSDDENSIPISNQNEPEEEEISTKKPVAMNNSDPASLEDISPFYSKQPDRYRGPRNDKRPEKTVDVANRIIGSALGMRIPRTEEQKQFQRAQEANEKKRREKEKAKKADDEKLKKSMWEDD